MAGSLFYDAATYFVSTFIGRYCLNTGVGRMFKRKYFSKLDPL